MILSRVFSKLRINRNFLIALQSGVNRSFSDDKNTQNALGDFGSKYQVFRDEDSEFILDIYEQKDTQLEPDTPRDDTFLNINLERGTNGVYEIEDLVEVLQLENAQDIFVAELPKEINYIDYICIVTGKSVRHMKAIAQFVRKVYKKKRLSTDLVPRLEGAHSTKWMALDLGNIALHIFSQEARILYDLETLWTVGPNFDKEYNKQDPVTVMLEKNSLYLHDLKPAI